jgi:hypothetical protein
MAMWSIFAAPLLMSNDLRRISAQAKDILLNREVAPPSPPLLLLSGFHGLGFGRTLCTAVIIRSRHALFVKYASVLDMQKPDRSVYLVYRLNKDVDSQTCFTKFFPKTVFCDI